MHLQHSYDKIIHTVVSSSFFFYYQYFLRLFPSLIIIIYETLRKQEHYMHVPTPSCGCSTFSKNYMLKKGHNFVKNILIVTCPGLIGFDS